MWQGCLAPRYHPVHVPRLLQAEVTPGFHSKSPRGRPTAPGEDEEGGRALPLGSEAKPMVWGHSGSGGQTLPTKGGGCRVARIPRDLFGKERGHTHRLSRRAHGCDEDAGSSCQQRGTIGAFQRQEIFLPSRETKLSEVEAADRRFLRRYFLQ